MKIVEIKKDNIEDEYNVRIDEGRDNEEHTFLTMFCKGIVVRGDLLVLMNCNVHGKIGKRIILPLSSFDVIGGDIDF